MDLASYMFKGCLHSPRRRLGQDPGMEWLSKSHVSEPTKSLVT